MQKPSQERKPPSADSRKKKQPKNLKKSGNENDPTYSKSKKFDGLVEELPMLVPAQEGKVSNVHAFKEKIQSYV